MSNLLTKVRLWLNKTKGYYHDLIYWLISRIQNLTMWLMFVIKNVRWRSTFLSEFFFFYVTFRRKWSEIKNRKWCSTNIGNHSSFDHSSQTTSSPTTNINDEITESTKNINPIIQTQPATSVPVNLTTTKTIDTQTQQQQNASQLIAQSATIGMTNTKSDLWYRFKHFIHQMCFCNTIHSLKT